MLTPTVPSYSNFTITEIASIKQIARKEKKLIQRMSKEQAQHFLHAVVGVPSVHRKRAASSKKIGN